MSSSAEEHERGLRALGLWPGPLDSVAAAPSRAAAVAELVNLHGLARSAKRLLARRLHPDITGVRGRVDELTEALRAAEWIASIRVDDVWSAPDRSKIDVVPTSTGIRIVYRGKAGA